MFVLLDLKVSGSIPLKTSVVFISVWSWVCYPRMWSPHAAWHRGPSEINLS